MRGSFTRMLALWFSVLLGQALAYIPATPTNDSAAAQASVNQSDTSFLSVNWYPNASFSEVVLYQLAGQNSTGVDMGALVYFSEQNVTNDPTTTPWIAFVSCDSNGTDFSTEQDIFTTARDLGAVAALLYSEWSEVCLINPEYADPTTFHHVLDIFSTKSLDSARAIVNDASTQIDDTLYGSFNAATLNSSQAVVNQAIAQGSVTVPTYLIAYLTVNGTVSDPGNNTGSGGNAPNSNGSIGNNINLAMIVFYVITSAISVLF